MALSIEQEFNCLGCSDNDQNIYVDDILKVFINYLNACTCIPWVRSHENIDRPDINETGEVNGQYGLIEVIRSERVKTNSPVQSSDTTTLDNSDDNIGCYEIYSERDLTIQLNVYRENGEANRDQESSTIVQPVGAGIDVLERIIDIYQIPRIKNLLIENGITIKDFGAIEWNKESVHGIWENIGDMQIEAKVCATSSISDMNIKCIRLQICGESPKELCKPFEGC